MNGWLSITLVLSVAITTHFLVNVLQPLCRLFTEWYGCLDPTCRMRHPWQHYYPADNHVSDVIAWYNLWSNIQCYPRYPSTHLLRELIYPPLYGKQYCSSEDTLEEFTADAFV